MRLKHLSIGLLGALAAALAVVPAMAQIPADVLKQGTVFHFEATRNGKATSPVTVTIISVTGDKVAAKRVEDNQERNVPDALCDVKFPLSVGATWSYGDCTFERHVSGQWWSYRYNGNAKVAGEEMVEVGGQMVKAFVIDYEETWVNTMGGGTYSYQLKQKRWIAPSAGYYTVKFESYEKHRTPVAYTSKVAKIDLSAAANPAAAPAPATPVATAAVPAKQ